MSKTIYTQKQLKRTLSKKFAKVEADASFPGVRVAGVDLGDNEEKRLVAQYNIVFKNVTKVSTNNTTVFVAWKRGVATGTTKRALVTQREASWEQTASFDLQLLQHRDGSFDKKMMHIELKEDVLVKKKGQTQWKILGRAEVDLGKYAKSHSEQVVVELKKKRKKSMLLLLEITAHWKKFDHHRFERVLSTTKLPKFADAEEERKATRMVGSEKYLLHTDYSDISDIEVSEDESIVFAQTDDEDDTIDEDYVPKFSSSNPFADGGDDDLEGTNPFGGSSGEPEAVGSLTSMLRSLSGQQQPIQLLDSLSSSSEDEITASNTGLSQDAAQAVLVKEAMAESAKRKKLLAQSDKKRGATKENPQGDSSTEEAFPGIKTRTAAPVAGRVVAEAAESVASDSSGSNPFSAEDLSAVPPSVAENPFNATQKKWELDDSRWNSEADGSNVNVEGELKDAMLRESGYQKLLNEYEAKIAELKRIVSKRDATIIAANERLEQLGKITDLEGKTAPVLLVVRRRQSMLQLIEKNVYLSHPLFNKSGESISALVLFDELMALRVFDQSKSESRSLFDLLLNGITLFCQVPTRRPITIAYWITTSWQLLQLLRSRELESFVGESLRQLVVTLFTRLFTTTIRRIEAQLLEALGTPFEASIYFKSESLSFNNVVSTLDEVLNVLLSNHCSHFVINAFFKLLVSFINRYLVNSVLNTANICTFNNGMRIKMEVSFLCQWLMQGAQAEFASSCPELLEQIKEVAQLLTMSKTRQATKALQQFEALNARQMRRILRQYQSGPGDPEEPDGKIKFDVIPPSFSSASRELVEGMVPVGHVPTDAVDPLVIRHLESQHDNIEQMQLDVEDDLVSHIDILADILRQ